MRYREIRDVFFKVFVGAAAILVSLFAADNSFGHALGTFTLNHSHIFDIGADRIVHYALLDFAETPSFEQFMIVDADGDRIVQSAEMDAHAQCLALQATREYYLSINGQRLNEELKDVFWRFSEGVVRVTCMQVLMRLEAPLPKDIVPAGTESFEMKFENRAFADHLGRCDIRLLWPCGTEIGDIAQIRLANGDLVKPMADREQSLYLRDTRNVQFDVRRLSVETRSATTVVNSTPTFKDLEPYWAFEFVPQVILKPDGEGRYHIFHITLSRQAGQGQTLNEIKPRALQGLPAIPAEKVGTVPIESGPPPAEE